MHYWVEHSNRSGKCHTEVEDARIEIVDAIIEKMGTARTISHRVECAEGIVSAAQLYPDDPAVEVGRDSWRILECTDYTCSDMSHRADW